MSTWSHNEKVRLNYCVFFRSCRKSCKNAFFLTMHHERCLKPDATFKFAVMSYRGYRIAQPPSKRKIKQKICILNKCLCFHIVFQVSLVHYSWDKNKHILWISNSNMPLRNLGGLTQRINSGDKFSFNINSEMCKQLPFYLKFKTLVFLFMYELLLF